MKKIRSRAANRTLGPRVLIACFLVKQKTKPCGFAFCFKEREGWDGSVSLFPSPPFGLRHMAVILDRAAFASLSRGQSSPRRGFSSPVFLWNKKRSLAASLFVSRRERDSNPRSCDRLRISRPAHSTTLASLRGLHNIVKNIQTVYGSRTFYFNILFYYFITSLLKNLWF